MRKMILLLVVLSLSLSLSLLIGVGVEGVTWERQVLGPDVVIESLTLNPYPVEPGKSFDLTIKVRNSNLKRTVNSPRFTIQESYPFTLESSPKVQVLNSLIPNEETLVTFRIKVDENAIGDVNNLVVQYQEGTRASYLSDPIKIDVKAAGIELSVASIDTVPEEIYPGDEVQLKLILTNTLPVLMKNLDINLDLSGSGVPLIPLGTTTQRTLTALNKGNRVELLFEVSVDAEAEPGVYKMPLSINYDDEFGNSYNIDTLTGIKISTAPEIQLDIEKSGVRQAFSAGDVVVKLSNVGLADLKFLTVKLQPSEDYSIVSSPQIYIGNLESDDYDTASFKVLAKSFEKNLPLKLLLNYKDSFNKEFESEEIVYVPGYAGFRLSSFGLNGILKVVFYIILISFVYISFKEWRKTKNLPGALRTALITVLIKIKRIIKSIRPRTFFRGIKRIIRFIREP